METRLPQQPYTLVYGSHPVLRPVLAELKRTGDPIVLVAPQMPTGAPRDIELLAGDPTDDGVVQRSEPARANRALIACTLTERPVDDTHLSRPLSDIRAQPGALVLGIARGEQIDLGLGEDPVLSADDRLIVLSSAAQS